MIENQQILISYLDDLILTENEKIVYNIAERYSRRWMLQHRFKHRKVDKRMVRIYNKTIFFITVLFVLLCFMNVSAVPAAPGSWEHKQPDGSVISLYKYGDENYNFIGDSEGYLVEQCEDGGYAYVTKDADGSTDLSPTAKTSRPANAVKGFDLAPAPSTYEDFETAPDDKVDDIGINYADTVKRGVSFGKNLKGDRKLLVVVVEYNDIQIDTTVLSNKNIYDKFFSLEEGAVSVASYYNDQSQGRFKYVPAFTIDDVGATEQAGKKITDADTTDTYGFAADGVLKVKVNTTHPGNNGSAFIPNAVAAVDPYIDFTAFNTTVESVNRIMPHELTVFFLLAGYEASYASGNTPIIWAHRTSKSVTADGLKLFRYQEDGYVCGGAMLTPTLSFAVGTACHELGHTLDLPDLYNVANSNINYSQVGHASLMSVGSWSRKSSSQTMGSHPSGLDAWSKMYFGWYEDSELLVIDESHKGTYSLVSQYANTKPDASKNIYRFIKIQSTADPKEYYILENRDFNGSDAGLKYSGNMSETGVALWKVDESIFNTTHPGNSRINSTFQCGLSLMRNGLQVTGASSSAETTKEMFYTAKKPLWSRGTNKFTFFGKQSYPNNDLVTASGEETSSGVGIEFLSNPNSEIATIKAGANDVDKIIYTSSGNTKVYMFNNTANTISASPVIVEYGENILSNVVKYDPLTIDANSYKISASKGFTLNGTSVPAVLSVNFQDLKPYKTVQQ